MGDKNHHEMSDDYDDDTPASILTPAQREYFLGERHPNEGSKRALLQRVRKRVQASFFDVALLVHSLPSSEIEKIRPGEGEKVPPVKALAGLLYYMQPEDGLLLEEVTLGPEPDPPRDRRAAWAENDIKRGIEQAIARREGADADVDVSITVDRGESLEELAEGDLTQLPRDVLDKLLYSGVIDGERYAEANRKRMERDLD